MERGGGEGEHKLIAQGCRVAGVAGVAGSIGGGNMIIEIELKIVNTQYNIGWE